MRRFIDFGYILSLMLSLGLAGAYVAHRDLPAQYRFYKMNEEYTATLGQEYDALVVQEQKLVDKVDGLERDPIEMEENVRHQKQLARPGERLYRIEPRPAPSSQ